MQAGVLRAEVGVVEYHVIERRRRRSVQRAAAAAVAICAAAAVRPDGVDAVHDRDVERLPRPCRPPSRRRGIVVVAIAAATAGSYSRQDGIDVPVLLAKFVESVDSGAHYRRRRRRHSACRRRALTYLLGLGASVKLSGEKNNGNGQNLGV